MTEEADDAAAIAALGELGLSTYAARTFVGLQKLGVATASEVADVTDVPRSQVYGATEELESVGLVDTHQSSPRRYRAVDVETARDLLYQRLQSRADDALDHLEAVQGQRAHRDDARRPRSRGRRRQQGRHAVLGPVGVRRAARVTRVPATVSVS